jgi:hypothetical protein
MGDKIKTALEIALEKAAMLEDLSSEEKAEIANKKKLEPFMVKFYRGGLKPEDLWSRLKNEDVSLLKMAEINLIDSLKFNLAADELERRAKAVIAVESLKKEPKTSAIQQGLGTLAQLQKRAESEKNQVYSQFKGAIEKNPQARTRVIDQGGSKMVVKLSVEEAIAQNPQWKQFSMELDQKYIQEFENILIQVKKYI